MVEIISGISFSLCMLFTYLTSKQSVSQGGQSIRESMLEAWENILWGFSLNIMANLVLLPLMLDQVQSINVWEAFLLGWPYTLISLIRSFWIRRRNNKKVIEREINEAEYIKES